jgi:N-acetyl-gamma-glutamyl-phosphate/LysW-gamma-L-alpha-aminoadipyl-6-phosphate reductase
MKASVVGASGYVGGDLLRILLGHPHVELQEVTSDRHQGSPVGLVHPNLRGVTDLRFSSADELNPCDVLFIALPHGESMRRMRALLALAPLVIDLTADFRIRDADLYAEYHREPHAAPELVDSFVTGCPELNAAAIPGADRIAVPGCMANAAMLALAPVASAGLLAGLVHVDARTGSSGSGRRASERNGHAERSGAMRVFAVARHRHEAEIRQLTGLHVQMSATGVEAVRGVQVLARAPLTEAVDHRDLRALYRQAYGDAPFVRLVAQRRGTFRYPDPKVLLGSNFCDVGFEVTADGRAVVLISALDNLVKGAGGNAVQCLNVRAGWAEDAGLRFPGLHPV